MPRNDAFLGHLSEVPLFSALSRKELALVARRAEDVQVDAGRVLVSEGATGAEFFVILTGTAKVSRRGRKVATLGPGAAFGELALLDKAPRNATVTAETPMELVVLGQREFGGVIDEVPGVARKLLTGMARRLREADAHSVQQRRVPTAPITDRPIRVGIVGLGQIAELVVPAYLARDDVTIVAACDRDITRLERWRPELPDTVLSTDVTDVLAGAPDVVDVLVPTPHHATVALPIIEAGFAVQLQKPIARSLEDCLRLTAAARANGTTLRVLEDYVFFPPLVQLRDVVRSGEIGDAVGVHMKIVNTGRGGWDVLPQSWEWQLEQTRDGRGMLVFDHGWHQLAVAIWLFGPIRRVFGWIGSTEVAPGYALDAPASLVWEHTTGLRGGLDLTLAVDTYFRSDFYSCDERVEVTGSRGSVRCNRISAFGRQEPSVQVYRDGETREYHALADGGDAGFAASAAAMVAHLRGEAPVPDLDAVTTEAVMRALIGALDSARLGHPVDVDTD